MCGTYSPQAESGAGGTVTVLPASLAQQVAAVQAAIAGTPMDLIDAPNGTAIAAVQAGLATSGGQTSILNAVNAITRNTARSMPVTGAEYLRPATGTNTYTVLLLLYNLAGQLEDPDANAVTLSAGSTAPGTDRNTFLSGLASGKMARAAAGTYTASFAVAGLDQPVAAADRGQLLHLRLVQDGAGGRRYDDRRRRRCRHGFGQRRDDAGHAQRTGHGGWRHPDQSALEHRQPAQSPRRQREQPGLRQEPKWIL